MKEILSNISGRVIACNVKAGDEIAAGDEVLMVESMKMEIPVESEESGRVVELFVGVGDEIEEGQRLAVLA